jgi:hypothetical protein
MNIAINKIEIRNEILQQQLINIDMKTIGIIGLILSLIGFAVGVYCQLEILPSYNALDAQYDLSEIDRALWRTYGDQKFLFGSIALFLGALASVMGLITGIKKQKIGWLILGLGLISFVLGALQSTHMFS